MTTTATVPPVTDPSATTPATPQAPTAPAEGDPNWLNARIAQAKKSAETELLKSLGATSPDEVKAALAAKKAADDANKTAAEKVAELSKQHETSSARATSLEAVVKSRAAIELAKLTDVQKAAVQAIAGEDPAAQLSAIDKLSPTWASGTAPTAPVVTPPAGPKDTAPPRGAPPPATGSAVDHVATYKALKDSNPFAAAQYRRANAAALAEAETKKQ